MLHMNHSIFLLTFRLPLAENCIVININAEHTYISCICRGNSTPRPLNSLALIRTERDES